MEVIPTLPCGSMCTHILEIKTILMVKHSRKAQLHRVLPCANTSWSCSLWMEAQFYALKFASELVLSLNLSLAISRGW